MEHSKRKHGRRCGESVIDYIVINNEAVNKVHKMKVENRIETEHQSIVVE